MRFEYFHREIYVKLNIALSLRGTTASYRCLANHVSHVTLFREHSDAMPLNNYGRRLTQELTPLNDKRHIGPSADFNRFNL